MELETSSHANDGVFGVPDVCVVWIEVEGRQAYLFETDKLREMLGASRIVASTVREADDHFGPSRVFQAVSGEIGVWAPFAERAKLVQEAWSFGGWLDGQGVACTTTYLETSAEHFNAKGGDLKRQVIQELKRKAREARERRTRIDASPHCALFAPCRIHGLEYATNWNPGETQDRRRQLTGARAAVKLKAWESEKRDFYKSELEEPTRKRLADLGVSVERPIEFTDLSDKGQGAEGGQDQFIAFICADGDGLGPVLQQIEWNEDREDGLTPAERNRQFALQLDALQRRAFREALIEVVLKAVLPDGDPEAAGGIAEMVTPRVDLPMLPQLMGGDDLWAVVRRDLALPFACKFAETFAMLTRDDSFRDFAVVHDALLQTNVAALSISLGVAFAKAGHPAHAMIAAAESLLKNAKKLRKGEHPDRPDKPNEGCLDWHWIESSVSEEVADAREAALCYKERVSVDLDREFNLTTRPWTLTQTQAALDATKQFNRVARRKREQLEPILRSGLAVSCLQWEGWWKSLAKPERDVMVGLYKTLKPLVTLDRPATTQEGLEDFYWPWTPPMNGGERFTTPFLDLLALTDLTASKGGLLAAEAQ